MEAPMSDDVLFPIDNSASQPLDDDYEEITSDEVDRVVASLEELMDTTTSLNIRCCLEEAAANIYCLIYDEEDLEEAA
jgi:hypothetical protein